MPESEYLQFGGQAIVEGVMMRSPHYFAVACRAPNGKIVLRTEPLNKTWIGRQKWLKLPFLRGSWALLDSMALGTRAMKFASDVQVDPKYVEADHPEAASQGSNSIQNAAVVASMVAGLALGFAVFVYVPQLVAQLVGSKAADNRGTATNVLAEFIKIILFLGYLKIISTWEPIKEVFRYHGAEHKAINTYEANEPLDLEHTAAITRLHPRCGTSFAIIVLFVSLLIFPFVPRYPFTGHPGAPLLDTTTRVLIELCILPIIAGISYELLRFAGKMRDQRWVQIAFSPGLASQKYLTTLEPENKHLEVAIVSLDAVVHAEATGECRESNDYNFNPAISAPA